MSAPPTPSYDDRDLEEAIKVITLLEERLEEAQSRGDEPIAIIGMGCRFPGGANNPDAFWDILNQGFDTSCNIPPDRWNIAGPHEAFFATIRGHFLDARPDGFDASLFGLAPAELAAMDPQQRLLLEVAWEAFEDAGLSIDALAGSRTAVFVGIEKSDYERASLFSDDLNQITPHTATGVAQSNAAGRIAYNFDLRGPVGVVDAACASSLLALDQACQKLSQGSADLALAGGVSLMLGPETFAALSKLGALAPDGRCKTFDAEANGYGRGEGCGVLVLKRLSDAQRDSDRIQAVIHGVAVGHGGRGNGLTAPNVRSQADVIRAALASAKKTPCEVDYLEAHGTGTQLGDPIEIAAITEVFGPARPADRPLLVGSAKSNIGHLEAAAGMAGLVKLALAYRHGELPPNCNINTPNTLIDWETAPVELVTRSRDWKPCSNESGASAPRLAGISSFGFSGTVAHAIIGPPPKAAAQPKPSTERPVQILALSGQRTEALAAVAGRFSEALGLPGSDLPTVCANANVTRKHHALRAALISDTSQDMKTLLKDPLTPQAGRVILGRANPNEPARAAFVFSGQGGLRSGVGRDLYGTVPAFTDMIDACGKTLDPLLGRHLHELLFDENTEQTAFDDPQVAQPALFALQVALVAMWRNWGVVPSVVFGHSFGHFAAAHTAGVLSLGAALDLVIARGQLAQSNAVEGRMAACFTSAAEVEATARATGVEAIIAAYNAPENSTVSATPDAMEQLTSALIARGVTVKPLPIRRAFHSHHMQPMAERFEKRVAAAQLQAPKIPLILDLTGRLVTGDELTDPSVWTLQLLEPVQCMKALETLRARGCTAALEIGASAVMSSLGEENADPDDKMAWLPSLRRSTSGWQQALATLGELHVRGVPVDWRRFHSEDAAPRIKLPTYPFQRKAYRLPMKLPDQMRPDEPSDRQWTPVRDWLLKGAPPAKQVADDLAAAGRFGRRHLAAFAHAIGLFDLAQLGRTETELLAMLDILPAHERLMRWYVDLLLEDGWLGATGDMLRSTQRAHNTDFAAWAAETRAEEKRLQEHHPDMSAAFELLRRCFEALPDILSGARDPMEVLMPGGSAELLGGIYGQGRLSQSFNSVMAMAVPAAAEGISAPRILEIGGGTGGVTQGILDSFAREKRDVSYTFTDISDGFVRPARARWANTYPAMEFATLDATLAPSAQGFEAASQDAVVASNVLHATRDMQETLRNAAELLRPGGKLIINEVTRLHDVVGMIFGLTPGWWQYEDDALRISHSPVLSVSGWRKALDAAGFTVEEVLTLSGDDPDRALQSVIVARLVSMPARLATTAPAVAVSSAPIAAPEPASDHIPAMCDLVKEISGIELAQHDLDSDLFALGLDSLLLMQLRNAIQKRFGANLKMSSFHDEMSSVRRIADYLSELAPPPEPPAAPSPAPTSAPAVTQSPPIPQAHEKHTAPAQVKSALEEIVQQQLKLMSDQIALLSGQQSGLPAPQPDATATPVPETPTVPPPKPATLPAAHQQAPTADLTKRQQEFLQDLIRRYNAHTAASKAYASKARPQLADWIATIGFSPELKELIYPIVTAKSEGSRLWDIDGNAYIDLACGFGVGLLGHQPAFITDAIRAQLDEGMELATQSDLAAETASLLCELTGCERVAFSNTGTEAVMTAFRLARAVTGKPKIAIFKGSFHGSYDGAMAFGSPLGTMSASLGVLQNQIEDVIVLDYGTDAALDAIAAEADQLAGVLVEPVQSRNPDLQPRDFLHRLRQITEDRDIALVFDELITGFRCHPGGAQAHFGVTADIVTYGKVLGGGLPISAIAGKARFIDPMDGGAWRYGDSSGPTATQIFFGGTFCRHPLAMASAHATLTHLKEQGPALQERLSARTRAMTDRLNAMFARLGIPFRIAGFASQFQVRQVTPQGELYQTLPLSLFFFSLMLRGIYSWERRTCFLSTAHSDADISTIEDAMEAAAKDLLLGGFFGGDDGGGKTIELESPQPTHLPLTATQREMRLMALKQRGGDRAEMLVGEVAGPIDSDRLQIACNRLVERHDVLRAQTIDGDALILGSQGPCLSANALSDLDHDLQDGDGTAWIAELAGTRIDPQRDPLLAFDLLDLENGRALVALRAHPLICDGWSMGVMITELAALYSGGADHTLEPSTSFGDFADWAASAKPDEERAAQGYWRERLSQGIEPIVLPIDRLALRQGDKAGRRLHRVIGGKAAKDVLDLSVSRNTTPFVVLLSAYSVLLTRLSGASRLAIAIPVPGQASMEASRLVGQCAATFPLVMSVDTQATGNALLGQVKHGIMAMLDHQCVRPQDAIQDDTSPPPLSVGFNLDRDPGQIRFEGQPVSIRPVPIGDPKYALNLNVITTDGQFLLDFDYDATRLDTGTVAAWADAYSSLLSDLCDNPERRIDDIGRRPVTETGPLPDLPAAMSAALSNAPDRVLATDADGQPVTAGSIATQNSDVIAALADRLGMPVPKDTPSRVEAITAWQNACGLEIGATLTLTAGLPVVEALAAAVLGKLHLRISEMPATGQAILLPQDAVRAWIREWGRRKPVRLIIECRSSPLESYLPSLQASLAEGSSVQLILRPHTDRQAAGYAAASVVSDMRLVRFAPLDGLALSVLNDDGQPTLVGCRGSLHADDAALGVTASLTASGEVVALAEPLESADARALLLSNPEVAQAEGPLDRLVVTTIPEAIVTAQELAADLARMLPGPSLPRNISLHRDGARHDSWQEKSYEGPTAGAYLETILDVFRDHLDQPNLSAQDSFFDFGGTSLTALRVAAQIERRTGQQLDAASLFRAPTPAGIAENLGAESYPIPATGLLRAPASPAQKRMWTLSQVEGQEAFYVLSGAFVFDGLLDRDALQAALNALFERHGILRTGYDLSDGALWQIIRPSKAVELSEHMAEDGEAALARHVQELTAAPFDLSAGRVFRTALLCIDASAKSHHALVYAVHHIAFDGWSEAALIADLTELYQAALGHRAADLPELKLQHIDACLWQDARLHGPDGRAALDRWAARLKDLPQPTALPHDRPRSNLQSFAAARCDLRLSRSTTAGLRDLARQAGTTPYLAALAGLKALIHRYTGSNDITFGTALTRRGHPDLLGQIGNFVNTLPLRDRLSGSDSFRTLLWRVADTAADAFADGDTPLDAILNRIGQPRDVARAPLFDILVSAADIERPELVLGGVAGRAVDDLIPPASGFDLYVEISTDKECALLRVTYNSDLFDEDRIARMGRHLETLLAACIRDPSKPIALIPLLDASENAEVTAYSQSHKPELYVFDDRMALCPVGIEGTIFETCARDLPGAIPHALSPSGWLRDTGQRAQWTTTGRLAYAEVTKEPTPVTPAMSSDETTKTLLEMWRRFLPSGAAPTTDDSFFALGGNSLGAVQIVAQVRDTFGVDLRVKDLFERPSVGAFQGFLGTLAKPGELTGEAEEDTSVTLAPAQERMWLLDNVAADKSAYCMSGAFWIGGRLDMDRLRQALRAVAQRHEALRSFFSEADDGTPHISIAAQVEPALTVETAPDEATALARAAEMSGQGFDMSRAPLWRVHFTQAGARTLLTISLHHAIADGWSVALFLRDLTKAYQGEALPAASGAYREHARRSRLLLDSPAGAESRGYWQETLRDAPQEIALFTDRPRPSVKSYRGGVVHSELDATTAQALRALATAQRGTLYQVLMALSATLLHRHSGQSDLVIGSVAAGRHSTEEFDQIGCFIENFALRLDLDPETTFETLLAQTVKRLTEAQEHSRYPVELLGQSRGGTGRGGRLGLFNIIVTVEEFTDEALSFDGHPARTAQLPSVISRADLIFYLRPSAKGIAIEIEYDADLFDAETIERMAEHLGHLAVAAANAPTDKLSTLPLIGAEEREAVVSGFNQTATDYPRNRNVVDLFREVAQNSPDAIALRHHTNSVTYREVDLWSDRIAAGLVTHHGVKPGDLVALMSDRQPALIAAMLGVLKAGGTYVPIDADYPAERIATLLDIAKPKLTLGGAGDARPSDAVKLDAVEVDPDGVALPEVGPEAPAYVMFTSGSTGTPKGVVVPHRAIVRLVRNSDVAPLGASDTLLLTGALSFDATTYEIWGPLLNGGRLLLADRETLLDPWSMAEVTRQEKVTVIWLTATLFNQFADLNPTVFEGLHTVLTGGERISARHVATAMTANPSLVVVNGYGPTENTTFSATHRIETPPEPGSDVPIGRPIANSTILILDPAGAPAPVGLPGEICVGGDGLALGYLDRDDLTAERFSTHPDFGRLYRTGDLGLWMPDGTVRYLGRGDDQLKIRGNRIEPGEIAAVLEALDGVRQAAVIARPGPAGPELAAYVVTDPHPDMARLRKTLAERLPEAMVPAHLIALDALPVDANGKLDRRALPDPADIAPSPTAGRAPANRIETEIAEEWSTLLGAAVCDVDADFFALGGHSLLAVRLINRLQARYGPVATLRDLFEQPTVSGLARCVIDGLAGGTKPAPALLPLLPASDGYAASAQQQRLCFLQKLDGPGPNYTVIGGYWLDGSLDEAALETALATVSARHEALRTRFQSTRGKIRQCIDAEATLRLERHDLSDEDNPTKAAKRLARNIAAAPWDLANGPLARAVLIRTARDRALFLLSLHHAICDGWSMEVLTREVTTAYLMARSGDVPDLPGLPCQPKDIAAWQTQRLAGPEGKADLAYWTRKLDGLPPPLDLHGGRASDLDPAGTLAHRSVVRLDAHRAGLEALGTARKVSLFTVLAALTAAALHRLSGQTDLWLGTPVAGRNRPEFEDQVGYLSDMVVLRSAIDPQDAVAGFVGQTGEAVAAALSHQDIPLDAVVRALGHGPDRPLFNAIVALEDIPALPELPELTLTPFDTGPTGPKTGLSFTYLQEADGTLSLQLDADPAQFTAERTEQLARTVECLIASAICAPEKTPLAQLRLTSPDERTRLLESFGRCSDISATPATTVLESFATQAASDGDAAAVTGPDATLTYGELDMASNAIAHALRDTFGITTGARVGLALPRDTRLIAAMLGILKAGAAYVPVDPSAPVERVAGMLADAECAALITDATAPGGRWGLADRTLVLDDLSARAATPPNAQLRPDDLAYVIFTSGSTGRPKGVMIEHRSVAALVAALHQTVYDGLEGQQTVALVAPHIFDASVQQIFAALCGGHRLLVVDAETRRDGRDLMDLFAREAVTVSDATPSLLSLLRNFGFARRNDLCLRHILVGGEALATGLARDILEAPTCPMLKLTNVYGPTEATVDCTALTLAHADLSDDAVASIGRPLGQAQLLVLDSYGEPVPVGTQGEIHVGGPGLARGYLDPALTRERFVEHPEFDRLYRTGDMGLWDEDAKLHFLGRRDDQVKLRGYRIELAEVESGLSRIKGVRHAACILSGQGETAQLLGFAQCATHAPADLRQAAAEHLPDYMIPADIIRLDALPMTPSGKVDRLALAALDRPKRQHATHSTGPDTDLEHAVAQIWARVMDRPMDDMQADFFACGGHSLAAAQLINLVEEAFAVTVSLRAFFAEPTPAGLCALIEAAPDAQADLPAQQDGDGLLSPAQYRLWAIDQMHGDSAGYAMPAAWRVTGAFDPDAFARAADMLVSRHDALRTRFEMRAGRPVQIIDAASHADIAMEEIAPCDDSMAEALDRCAKEVACPFDLENGPLLRFRLWSIDEHNHVLFVNAHHIIVDGQSLDMMARDLWSAYASIAAGKAPELGPDAPSFQDHVAKMRARADGPKAQSDLRRWQEVLTPLPPPLDLPMDQTRPPLRSQSGASLDIPAAQKTQATLAKVAKAQGTTPFAVLTALSAYAMYALSDQQGMFIGVPLLGRPDRDSQSVIGLCTETVPLRVTLDPHQTFGALLTQVKSNLAEMLDRRDCPFDRIVEAIKPPSRPDRSILFDVMVSYRRTDPEAAPCGLDLTPLPLPVQGSQLDLTLLFAETPEALTLSLQYDDALFEADRIRGIGNYVLSLLDRIAAFIDQPIAALPRPDVRLLAGPVETAPAALAPSGSAPGSCDKMLDLWRDVLGQAELGPDDNFFAAGGHSLTAARLVQKVYAELGAEIRLSDVMRNPTAAALERHLQETTPDPINPVKRLPEAADYALSPAQRRFWVLEQLEGQEGYGLLPGVVELTGALDQEALTSAIDALCSRHEALRTVILTDDTGVPRQRILPDGAKLITINLKGSDTPEAEAEAWLSPLLARPFDIGSEALFRIGLAQIGAKRFLLGFCLHHMIADGWSMDVLIRDLSMLYAAARGDATGLPPLKRQYRDCAAHQITQAANTAGLDYWQARLSGPPPRLDLPTDRTRPTRQDVSGEVMSFELDPAQAEPLWRMAEQHDTSLFVILTAAFQTLLYRYAGQTDLTLGTPVAGRDHPDYADQVGLFLNQLALRVEIDPQAGFATLLKRTATTIREALEHQDTPFDLVVEALDLPRDPARSVLFDAMIVMQDPDHAELTLGDVHAQRKTPTASVSKTDLTLIAEPSGAAVRLHFEYATALFDPDTIARLIDTFGKILTEVAADPDTPLDALEVAPAHDRQSMLSWGGLTGDLPQSDGTILEYIAKAAARAPTAPATSDRTQALSYETIVQRSDHLARQLVQRGVAPGAKVGIELARDADLPAVLLGVLKAGAAFVPVDPVLPEARCDLLIAEAACALVLSGKPDGKQRIDIEMLLEAPDTKLPLPEITPDMLAYVLFTSGSTGKPKGVMIEHRALAAFCGSLPDTFGFGPKDRIAALTNISFDISILELLGGLTLGACVTTIDGDDAAVPARTLKALQEQRATVLQATPTRLALLMDEAASNGPDVFAQGTALRAVLTGGETVPQHLRERLALLEHLNVYEVYGPTETTIWTCARPVTGSAAADLGRPLPGEGLAVLSPEGALQPINAAGEITIFGAGLARGYLDDPERSAQTFPAAGSPIVGRRYRTGDRARWRSDGRLEFLGRTDSQIKLRGHRIELGEVEAVLSVQPDVLQAAVEVRGADTDAMLVAHVTSRAFDRQALLAVLRKTLPPAAVPGRVVMHDALPLLPSGKIDRRALAQMALPEPAQLEKPTREGAYNAAEAEIATVFADLLKLKSIDPESSFFNLGGQSLMAAQAVRQLRDRLGVGIDLGDIFAAPTVRSLAETLQTRAQADWPPLVASKDADACPLAHAQRRIWAAEQLSRVPGAYIIHAAMEIKGRLRVRALKSAFDQVIARHGALRTAFVTGIDGPRQIVHDAVPFKLGRDRARDAREISKLLDHDASHPFDLSQAPLLRARLIDTGKSVSILSMALHHTVADGRSLELFMRDLETAYQAAAAKRECPLPAPPLQFTDFAKWESQVLEAPSMQQDRDFWRTALSDLPAPFDLPIGAPRPKRIEMEGATIRAHLDADCAAALRAFSAAESSTLFSVFLAAVTAMVHRLTGREDMVIGTVTENRNLAALDGMIGCFVNVLPLRMTLAQDITVAGLVREAREVAARSLRHGHVPFEEIVRLSQAPATPDRSPLFDIAVTWNDLDHTARRDFAGLPLTDVSPTPGFAKYDMLIVFSPNAEGGIDCAIEHRRDLYSPESIEEMWNWLSQILAEMVSAPDLAIIDLEFGAEDSASFEPDTTDIVSILDI
ncbi:amino acid adenylation domain-containing protein [Ruegeria sp. 2205SS24-7]|uniref:non-ribosomal peptide synthetase/type I polyketide synthase n=1 Tax=Ruegeria discodermiae TaxID=3064389 RepID=UPI0027423712|nr:non-ribosomal peptide synthetase/type I polyketide synthase [Ruegeria sp. 2205SS24-7]MDP5218853.1 amino acid adenylation domain-containing protein [Ruegeria sp. 2205SS24-7]